MTWRSSTAESRPGRGLGLGGGGHVGQNRAFWLPMTKIQ